MQHLKEKVLEEYKKGNIVFAHAFGTESAPINDFIKQPIDGILFDLNRGEETVLTFIEDPKWINDYAVCKVIRHLHEENAKLKEVLTDCSKSLATYGSHPLIEKWVSDVLNSPTTKK